MRTFIAVVGMLALASCGDVPLEDEGPYDDEEDAPAEQDVGEVASTEQELAELGCSAITLTAAGNANGRRRGVGAGANVQQSPNWAYNPARCPFQYVVEYAGFGGVAPLYAYTAGAGALNASTAARGPLSSITNRSDCERTRLTIGIYVWNNSNPGYSALHTFQGRGRWIGAGIVPPHCATQKTGGTLAGPSLRFVGAKHKVRIAGRVEYCRPGDGCVAPLHTNLRVETKLERQSLPLAPL